MVEHSRIHAHDTFPMKNDTNTDKQADFEQEGADASTRSAFIKWWMDTGLKIERNHQDCMEVFMLDVARSAWEQSRNQASKEVCDFLLNLPPSECEDTAFHGIGELLQNVKIDQRYENEQLK